MDMRLPQIRRNRESFADHNGSGFWNFYHLKKSIECSLCDAMSAREDIEVIKNHER